MTVGIRPARNQRLTVTRRPTVGDMSNVVTLRNVERARDRRRRPERLWREAMGEVLREQRLDRDERIADVAGRAGVAPQYLSEIERGRKDPSSEILGAVAGALDLTVGEIAGRAATRLGRGALCLAA